MLVVHDRLNAPSKADPVGMFAYLREGRLIVVVLVTVDAVGVE